MPALLEPTVTANSGDAPANTIMSTLLVVDDDPGVVAAFRQVLRDQGIPFWKRAAARTRLRWSRRGRSTSWSWTFDCRTQRPGNVSSDQELDPRLRSHQTGHATTEAAIEATKLGAFDII